MKKIKMTPEQAERRIKNHKRRDIATIVWKMLCIVTIGVAVVKYSLTVIILISILILMIPIGGIFDLIFGAVEEIPDTPKNDVEQKAWELYCQFASRNEVRVTRWADIPKSVREVFLKQVMADWMDPRFEIRENKDKT